MIIVSTDFLSTRDWIPTKVQLPIESTLQQETKIRMINAMLPRIVTNPCHITARQIGKVIITDHINNWTYDSRSKFEQLQDRPPTRWYLPVFFNFVQQILKPSW